LWISSYIFLSTTFNGQIGYADIYNDTTVIFGKRNVSTITNTLTGKYLFKNNLSLNLKVRHYWSKGKYSYYYILDTDGHISESTEYTKNNDFNSNFFNVDLVFSWIFSPGSSLSIVWKNAIAPPEDQDPEKRFLVNLKDTFNSPQHNTISVKALYYIDYQMIRKRRTHN
jgi:hypothetical protein